MNPYINIDSIIQYLVNGSSSPNHHDQDGDHHHHHHHHLQHFSLQVLEERSDDELIYDDNMEYGIFSYTDQVWLTSSTPLASLKELQDSNFEEMDLLLTAKVAPLIIQFKEQSFNLEISSNNISIEHVLQKVNEKLDIPHEHRSRYALFLDDHGQPHEDEPAFGMLESDQTISDILNNNQIECVSYSFLSCLLAIWRRIDIDLFFSFS